MIVLRRLGWVAGLCLLIAADAAARSPQVLAGHSPAKLRAAADRKQKVVIKGAALGGASLQDLELEPMQVWADDALIVVDGDKTIAPPDIRYFRGRVVGSDDSSVFLAAGKGKVRGMVLLGEKRFNLGSLVPAGKKKDENPDAELAISEVDPADDFSDPASNWTCGVENGPVAVSTSARKIGADAARPPITANAGASLGAAYQLRIAVDTDIELSFAFGNDTAAISAYIAALVGQTSVIFQRDLNTSLVLGRVEIRTDSDPWGAGPESGARIALREFSNYYHNVHPTVPRSAAVLLSGKPFNGGMAWTGTLCGEDGYCGATGQYCGDTMWANSWAGSYAVCGITTAGVSTTVPDPTLTIGNVQYAMPNDNNYWMLLQFAHELGHLASSPHTHCVALTPADKELYGVTRDWVDNCSNEGGCSNVPATAANVPELGTIMSYCHSFFTGSGYRASRYIFGKLGEPSSKMLTYLRNGINGGTPDATIRLGAPTATEYEEESQPVGCGGGHIARVPECSDCTYSWSISGGTIESGAGTRQITYAPASPSVVLTVTVARANGCQITQTRSVSSLCPSLTPPAGFTATAASPSLVALTWTAVPGAARYEVYRRTAGTSFTIIATPSSTGMNDSAVQPGTAYLYRVRALDSNNVGSGFSTPDVATTFSFTDPSLTAAVTTIRTAHITELRTCVNAVRSLAGLTATSFSDPSLAGLAVRAAHIDELRSALTEARTAVGVPTPAYADAAMTPGSRVIRGVHIEELRQNVR